jgi:hypothetical protein
MGFSAIIHEQHDLVITLPQGRITNDELPAYYQGRLEAGTLRPGLRELVDGRAIDDFEVDATGQRALVDLLSLHRDRLEGVRWAFIAETPLAYGMFRMFEAQKADLPFETAVFGTAGAAADWLGIPVEALEGETK